MRHNKLIPIITRALREIKRPITEGETANWLRRNRSIRPFDIVTTGPALEEPGRAQSAPTLPDRLLGYDIGIADPTRLGRLPRGTPYYQAGDASRVMQNRKLSRYRSNLDRFGPLTRPAQYTPLIFEVTGTLGPIARDHFASWCKEAAADVREAGGANYRALGKHHTWNALKFSNLYLQMLSFAIVRETAISVNRAVESLDVPGY